MEDVNDNFETIEINGKIFKKRNINNRIEYFVGDTYIDRFKLLSSAYDEEDKKRAWEILKIASIIFHPQNDYDFNTLYDAVAFGLVQKFQKNEFYYHNLFVKNFSKIRNGKVISHSDDGKNIPDIWVEYKNGETPVEIKLHDFNKKALNQLLRYMNCYKTVNGIAVGEKLTVDLPPNIEFISLEELRNADLSKQEE